MRFQDAATIVNALPQPHTHHSRGRLLYDHIRRTRPEKLLEMGTARGGSAVFIAAALEANGTGHLTSVDSRRWTWKEPTPQAVLDESGVGHRVTLNRQFSTYTWFLKTEIERSLQDHGSVQPKYDFIFLDGAKNWTTDGLAVVLAERLLNPGGWLLLDDLDWSYANHVDGDSHYEVMLAELSDQERTQPHLRAVFDLLVRTNPVFVEFEIQDNWWAWARKSPEPVLEPSTVAQLTEAIEAQQAVVEQQRAEVKQQQAEVKQLRRDVDRLRDSPVQRWGRKMGKLGRDPIAFLRDASLRKR